MMERDQYFMMESDQTFHDGKRPNVGKRPIFHDGKRPILPRPTVTPNSTCLKVWLAHVHMREYPR